MENRMNAMLSVVAVFPLLKGDASMMLKGTSRCGDWTPFKDEKCFKVADKAGHQNIKDAGTVCEAFSKELHCESFPRVITIKTKEEQEFLQNLLFVQNAVFSNVWLGLKQSAESGKFKWNDGSEVFFSNWLDQNITDGHRQCVELESGLGVHSVGLWSKVDCKKVNVVVCERTQTWSLKTLQIAFLSYKMTQELREKERATEITSLKKANRVYDQEIDKLKQDSSATKQEITNLKLAIALSKQEIDTLTQAETTAKKEMTLFKQKVETVEQELVPVGFIYLQLPNQPPPTDLWPTRYWMEISANYSGLFFRVVGGNAAPFGEIQEGNTIHLEEVKSVGVQNSKNTTVSVPADGTWSEAVFSGENAGKSFVRMQFRLSREEIRPRNQAVKVWQRVR